MKWVRLSEERLPIQVVDAVATLLDAPRDLLEAVWRQVRERRAYRIFRLRLAATREVQLPSELLREVQLRVLDRILYTGPVSPASFAGVPGRHLTAAARRHLDRAGGYVLSLDIRDAYGSTSYTHVVRVLRKRLGQELWVLGLNRETRARVLGFLGYLLTVGRTTGAGRQLPLGAPTSVALFNLVCLELDGELIRLCGGERYRALAPVYTRYVDDLVFSGARPFRQEFVTEVAAAVSRNDYRLNPDKTRRAAVANATVYGLQKEGSAIVPAPAARRRLAARIRELRERADRPDATPRARLRAAAALRSIDGFLRQFYETAGTERPEALRFDPPPAGPEDLGHVDLLWG